MKINVHIERIVLDGLPVDRHSSPLIQEAIHAELSRLFLEGETPQSLLSGGSIPSLRTAPIQISQQLKPNALGNSIANAVHGGFHQ
jgi:hypothetical protein